MLSRKYLICIKHLSELQKEQYAEIQAYSSAYFPTYHLLYIKKRYCAEFLEVLNIYAFFFPFFFFQIRRCFHHFRAPERCIMRISEHANFEDKTLTSFEQIKRWSRRKNEYFYYGKIMFLTFLFPKNVLLQIFSQINRSILLYIAFSLC